MNYFIVGLGLSYAFLAVKDLRKHGWQPLERPRGMTAPSLIAWVTDRTYLLYAMLAIAAVPAALIVKP
ncbi:hypothetical protein [Novosphingobium sp.]|uniref:hypothetical protein n=1 Tax=Novosphingobium sp. TaxID=1874826 RepID=UPI0031DF5C54